MIHTTIVREIEVPLPETILYRTYIGHTSASFFCDRASGIEYEVLDRSCYNRGGM